MHILESSINRTKDYAFYFDSPADVGEIEIGALYRKLVKEYGRCIGRVYRDKKGGGEVAVGWVFLKRRKYDDSKDTFLCETWITLAKNVRHVSEHWEVEGEVVLPTH